jgi:hypothetical protein
MARAADVPRFATEPVEVEAAWLEELRTVAAESSVRSAVPRRISTFRYLGSDAISAVVELETSVPDESFGPNWRMDCLRWPEDSSWQCGDLSGSWRGVVDDGAESFTVDGTIDSDRLVALIRWLRDPPRRHEVLAQPGSIVSITREDRSGGRIVVGRRSERGDFCYIVRPTPGGAFQIEGSFLRRDPPQVPHELVPETLAARLRIHYPFLIDWTPYVVPDARGPLLLANHAEVQLWEGFRPPWSVRWTTPSTAYRMRRGRLQIEPLPSDLMERWGALYGYSPPRIEIIRGVADAGSEWELIDDAASRFARPADAVQRAFADREPPGSDTFRQRIAGHHRRARAELWRGLGHLHLSRGDEAAAREAFEEMARSVGPFRLYRRGSLWAELEEAYGLARALELDRAIDRAARWKSYYGALQVTLRVLPLLLLVSIMLPFRGRTASRALLVATLAVAVIHCAVFNFLLVAEYNEDRRLLGSQLVDLNSAGGLFLSGFNLVFDLTNRRPWLAFFAGLVELAVTFAPLLVLRIRRARGAPMRAWPPWLVQGAILAVKVTLAALAIIMIMMAGMN